MDAELKKILAARANIDTRYGFTSKYTEVLNIVRDELINDLKLLCNDGGFSKDYCNDAKNRVANNVTSLISKVTDLIDQVESSF